MGGAAGQEGADTKHEGAGPWIIRIRPNALMGCSPLRVNRCQLLSCSTGHHGLLGCFGLRLGVKSIKNGGTNKNGEKEGDNIHANTKKEGLPAADCVKGSSIHWILD